MKVCYPEPVETCRRWLRDGLLWVGPGDAADILGVDRVSLSAAAKDRGLGCLYYAWSGRKLMISTASLLKFMTGGEPMSRIFGKEDEDGSALHDRRPRDAVRNDG